MRDVALVGAGRVYRRGGVEIDVAGRADGVVGAEDRLERRARRRSTRRWRGRCGRRLVRELDQQKQLRERVVLAGDALGQPALRDAEQLREEPGLSLPSSSRKYFSSVSFASRNATSLAGGVLGRRACGCSTRRRSARSRSSSGMSAVESASCESSVNSRRAARRAARSGSRPGAGR